MNKEEILEALDEALRFGEEEYAEKLKKLLDDLLKI